MTSKTYASSCYHIAARSVLATTLLSGGAFAENRALDVPAEDAERAIPEFARQAGVQILAPSESLKGVYLPGIKGTYEVNEALRILLAGTNLTIESDDAKFITLGNRTEPTIIKTGDTSLVAQNVEPPAATPAPAAKEPELETVAITGSRIIREGYESPTPMATLGVEALEKNPQSNMLNLLATMPAVTGALTSASSAGLLSQTGAGVNALNLRSLGPNRQLVLLDGQRIVASTYGNYVDVNTIPEQLVSRVDVVTGGASAVYGSDAVGGVVNFILDKKFTGVKADVSGGETRYNDDRNYKAAISAGFGFAEGRGHVLLSGEDMYSQGTNGSGGRQVDSTGTEQITNPNYTATNGQPQLLVLPNGALATATAGGVIVAGPLKGTAFGQGGAPYTFHYGALQSGSIMIGGDWKTNDIRPYSDLDPGQRNQNLFSRVSYDITDNIEAFAQWGWSENITKMKIFDSWMPGSATSYVIHNDNPYIPASVLSAMAANNVTSFPIGSWNQDMPGVLYGANRITNRLNGGFEGKFDSLGTTWHWDANYSYGGTRISITDTAPSIARYKLAIDSVVDPKTGQIVCRSVLQGANNGCIPWNPLGVGVNPSGVNSPAYNYIDGGGAWQNGLIKQETEEASLSGAPFSTWAGPVSVALSAEHRLDAIDAVADPISVSAQRIAGNFAPLHGKETVSEGAVETLVPLAKDATWARNWDLSLAVRFTDYNLSGFATTWKVGTTYAVNDDIKFRLTRSRDLRAPDILELYQSPTVGTNATLIDRFLGTLVPGNTLQAVSGNPNLTPEKADNTGIGVVLTPQFLPDFAVSVDWWDVKIRNSIQQLNAQTVIDSCYTGEVPALCSDIIRGPDGTISRVNVTPINLAVQDVRGLDLESSYRKPLSDIVSGWAGNFSLHGTMTFYFKNYMDTKLAPPTDAAGQNLGSGPPSSKYNVTATYQLNPVSFSLTGRGFSSGTINNSYIECTSGCPAATVANPTINNNHLPGAFYLDANLTYGTDFRQDARAEFYLSVSNLLNKSVPPQPTAYYFPIGAGGGPYDYLGTQYRAGIRVRL